ncbi:hypothetical protein ACLI08_16280 [Flavobacterium sp. RNTU_13]|uniref:hypothetical protein n=1 Tax=Flavobacterium sp. RNTU_13 TaxID=3375145 RepID=UPI00398829ED
MHPIICNGAPPEGRLDSVRDLSAPDAIYHPADVKTMPRDKEGIKHFMDFITNHIDYKNLGLPKGKHRIFYSFIVEKDGSLSSVKIIKTPNKALGQMMTEAVAKAPKWIPATNAKDENVRMLYSLIHSFEIR